VLGSAALHADNHAAGGAEAAAPGKVPDTEWCLIGQDFGVTEEDAEAIRQYVLSEANRLYAYKQQQSSAASGE
jgi:hypothetical protein